MERVLVAELLYPKGHKTINKHFLECISKSFDITLLDNNEYFTHIDPVIIKKRLFVKDKAVYRRERYKVFCYFFTLRRIAEIAKKEKIEKVVLLSFHTISYWMAKCFFKGLKVFVVHHNDIDVLAKNKYFRFAFNYVKDDIIHCVLEDFIKDGLISMYHVPSNLVHTVNNPIMLAPAGATTARKVVLFLGIGQSNDEHFIKKLIDLDQTNYLGDFRDGKILLRSKKYKYEGKIVTVFTGFLEKEKYDNLYQRANACIVSYEATFNLRSSGSIEDAFRNRKKVIVTDFLAAHYYAVQYPNNCILCKSGEEIMELLKSYHEEYHQAEGLQFEQIHSFDNVANQWKNALSI